MTKKELLEQIKKKQTFLCVGLDPDISKIPAHLLEGINSILTFNKAIIDATKDYCVAYKPNVAFYERLGSKGWDILAETVAYIPDTHMKIADAKRDDIGNTAQVYAETYFETFGFDAVTINPYMGSDSILPYLEYTNRWVVICSLTSNEGAADFQLQKLQNGEPLFLEIMRNCQKWGCNSENTMFVMATTFPHYFEAVRREFKDYFFFASGVGVQGGSLQKAMRTECNEEVGLLVNSARKILYASNGLDFAKQAQEEAKHCKNEMFLAFSGVQ